MKLGIVVVWELSRSLSSAASQESATSWCFDGAVVRREGFVSGERERSEKVRWPGLG